MGYKWQRIMLEINCKEGSEASKIQLMMNALAHRAFPDKSAPFRYVALADDIMKEQADTDELIDGALETLSAYIDGHSTDDALVQVINELTASQEARQGR
jgi:hypothetical protein